MRGGLIGGVDIVIAKPAVPPSNALEAIVRHVLRHWPGAVLEDGSSGAVFPEFRAVSFARLREIIVYKDARSRQSWQALGADPSNANTMIYVIAEASRVTLVVDDPAHATCATIIREVRDLLDHGLPSSLGSGLAA